MAKSNDRPNSKDAMTFYIEPKDQNPDAFPDADNISCAEVNKVKDALSIPYQDPRDVLDFERHQRAGISGKRSD